MSSLKEPIDQLEIRLGSNWFNADGSSFSHQGKSFQENDSIVMVGGQKEGASGHFIRYCKGSRNMAVIHLEGGVGKCTSSLKHFEKRNDIWKKNEIPDVEHRAGHKMVVIPSKDGNNDHRLLLLCGLSFGAQQFFATAQCLQFNGSLPNPKWSSFPNMQEHRVDFDATYVDDKVYAFGGRNPDLESFEVLDLNDLRQGWVRKEFPLSGYTFCSCQAVAVDSRYIYVACTKQNSRLKNEMSLISYDTRLDIWNTTHRPPLSNKLFKNNLNCGITSIVIPREGTYIVVIYRKYDRSKLYPQQKAQAYHVESNKWIRLPNLPPESGLPMMRAFPDVTTIGNQNILAIQSQRVMVLDWKQKKWSVLLPKPEIRDHAAVAFVGGSVNKLIINGGWNNSGLGDDILECASLSLDIASGIGWAKEKLLLLCFQKKAQKDNVNVKGPCLLESLDSGTFANILTYLIVPFRKEIECKGSIFAGMLESTLRVSKRSCDTSMNQTPKKKSRNDEL